MISDYVGYELKIEPRYRKIAIEIFNDSVDSLYTIEEFARQFYSRFKNKPEMLTRMVDLLLMASMENDSFRDRKKQKVLKAVEIFGLSKEEYENIKAGYLKDTDKYYKILGVSTQSSNREIRRKYLELVKQYAPENIEEDDLPQEFIQSADDKLQEIREAYRAIKKERGGF